MQKLELTVHEFMTVMGALDERQRQGKRVGADSILEAWRQQYEVLDERLESLDMMDRADMLFDGKVTINAITDGQMKELIQVVEEQVAFHKKLIAEDDLDADPEDLEMWQARLAELKNTSTESL
jgi:hypothetical protein